MTRSSSRRRYARPSTPPPSVQPLEPPRLGFRGSGPVGWWPLLSWGTIVYGAALSAVAAAAAVAAILRERRRDVWLLAAVAAGAGAFVWNAILRHTGGDFFVDAPVAVFPISLQDTGSGVFATALATFVLGFGPLRTTRGQKLAIAATLCGISARLVDVYLY